MMSEGKGKEIKQRKIGENKRRQKREEIRKNEWEKTNELGKMKNKSWWVKKEGERELKEIKIKDKKIWLIILLFLYFKN